MKPGVYDRQRFIKANKILINARWVYAGVMLFTGFLSRVLPGIKANQEFSILGFILVGGGAYVGNLFFFWFFRHAENKNDRLIKAIGYFQIFFEQALVGAVIYNAGGIMSIGFIYFLYTLVASAFIFSFFEVSLFATTSGLIYTALMTLQYYDIIPFHSRYDLPLEALLAHNPATVITNVFAVVSSFYVTGIFSGFLANMIINKEKEITKEKEKSKEIVENLSDGLVYINDSGTIELVNIRAEEMLKIKKADAIGKNMEAIGKNTYPIFHQVAACTGKNSIVPYGCPELVYEINTGIIRGDGEKIEGRAIVIRDISREKFIDRVKSEFITIASHQLRTPLSAVKNALDLLQSGTYGEISKEQKGIMKKSLDYTDNLIMIVNDLLNVSSAEHGKFNYDFKPEKLNKLLTESVERFSNDMEKRRIKMELTTGDDSDEVEIDAAKLKLALGSIIDNAITYTPKSGKIKISGKVSDGSCLISVCDNGIGIPEKEQGKIFTKFFRSSNSIKVKTEGNGLDLYVAKVIVESHGGKIRFESEEGRGTCFFIEMPVLRSK